MSEVPLYDQTERRLLLSNQAQLTGGAGTREANRKKLEAFIDTPQKALCGGLPDPYLEPLTRSWSHFVGIYCQKLTDSVEN